MQDPDVDSVDDDSGGRNPTVDMHRSARIEVCADADPDVLLRVAVQLTSPTARRRDDQVLIEAQVIGCSDVLVDMICRKLAQLTCAHSVRVLP